MKVKNFNKKILEEYKGNLSLTRFPKLKQWIDGTDSPTLKQLSKVADALHIPFGYFFLDTMPERKIPIPNYRTKKDIFLMPSVDLIETIEFVQQQQNWVKDILELWGHEKLGFAGKYNIGSPKNLVVGELRIILGLENGWARSIPNWNQALKELIVRSEKAGIFVVVNGVVGNDTHRQLQVEEFRGFVLYDPVAPFIFINNNDAISGKIFTIVHELIHIIIGKSGSFDLEKFQACDDDIEQFCNKCAAEFLVPEQDLLKELKNKRNIENQDVEDLAKVFKVSSLVIIRRLLDISVINQDDFYNFYDKYLQTERKKHSKGVGGNFYATEILRLNKKFLEIVKAGVDEGVILHRDAYKITNLKASTFHKLMVRVT
ncbi:ImmA/IrrE family metallo-endopeptidase [Thermodesulfobium sp. 4217-1]|uniref:ImmA/IrrE family metallo-endopeptidase n=1 Tax=Thermodesulfobium sp. 4217-1 TaxID=3120013 RepID=UPI003221600C